MRPPASSGPAALFPWAVAAAQQLHTNLSLDDMIRYWVAQFIGAIVASLVVLIAYNDKVVADTTTQASVMTGKTRTLQNIPHISMLS